MSKIDDVQNEIRNTPGLGGSMARWSALGAVIAIPVPVVGPIFGALAGAAYAYSQRHKRT